MIFYKYNFIMVGVTENMESFNRIVNYFPSTSIKPISRTQACILSIISLFLAISMFFITLCFGLLTAIFYLPFILLKFITEKIFNLVESIIKPLEKTIPTLFNS